MTGLGIIKKYEDCKLRAYLCPAGIPTIGYGHTKNVKLGDTCTQGQANTWLLDDYMEAERGVLSLVKVPLTDNQLNALVSFVFNFGAPKFATSTLLKKINAGDFAGAVLEFPKWNKSRVNGELVVLPGLVKRRADEQKLFMETKHDASEIGFE